MSRVGLSRRAAAEFVGTALLLTTVVGSGIMGERLSGGNQAVALLANSLATGSALAALILVFGPRSGAHFNPLATISDAWCGGVSWRDVPLYCLAQTMGAIAGVGMANAMFGLPLFFASHHVRTGVPQWIGEVVATFGLISIIRGSSRLGGAVSAAAVGAYITAAYWFTSSTSFANPAVTLARAATDTFAGIRPVDVPGFVIAQIAGMVLGTVFFRWLLEDRS